LRRAFASRDARVVVAIASRMLLARARARASSDAVDASRASRMRRELTPKRQTFARATRRD
jgi:hypothetical protein